MKYRVFITIIALAVLMAGCSDGLNYASYKPLLPVIPPHWQEILGEPHWRLEWLVDEGVWQKWEGLPGSEPPDISFISEWTTPVLAWPFWPGRNLFPGQMRPSGALYPWDVSGSTLRLSWKGGVDAVFWKELALAERSTTAANGRLPWYFDWRRFRALFSGDILSEAVRLDPWLADWKDISRRTVQSGFDRRRIAAQSFIELTIPDLDGYWIGSSPFAEPLYTAPGYPLILKATNNPETWVSSSAIIKCSRDGWVLIRNEELENEE
jgi:hypothetical protein